MEVSGLRFPLALAAACALSAGAAPPGAPAAAPTSGATTPAQPKVNRLVMAQVGPQLEYNAPRNG